MERLDTDAGWRGVIHRLPRTIALAVIIGIGIFNLYHAVIGWTMADAGTYWNAAMRLRDGADLYPAITNADASEVYRYAPWFAWAAVPFTYLPIQVAGAIWSAVLLGASATAVVPLIRLRAGILVALFGPILVGISANGNVHALMIAVLLWTMDRWSGPVWIAVATSLKIFPILLALVYVGRRQWGRAAASVLLSALLWAPALLFDLRNYPVQAGQAASLLVIPPLYVVAGGVLVVGTVLLARTRFGWLTAATTVVLTIPRLFLYDATFLMLGVAGMDATNRSARSIE